MRSRLNWTANEAGDTCVDFPCLCNPCPPRGPDGPVDPPDKRPKPPEIGPGDAIVPLSDAVKAFLTEIGADRKSPTASQWLELGQMFLSEGLSEDARFAGEHVVYEARGADVPVQMQGMKLQAEAFIHMKNDAAAHIAHTIVDHLSSILHLHEQLRAPQ